LIEIIEMNQKNGIQKVFICIDSIGKEEMLIELS